MPALPEAAVAVAQGWGRDFYYLLLAETEPLPGLSARGHLCPRWLTAVPKVPFSLA